SPATIHFAVDAFLYAIGDGGLHFLLVRIDLAQTVETLLPFFEFGVTENGILDDLITLILGAQGACLDIGLRGANEVLERRVHEGRLRIHVEKRGSSAFEAKR